MIATPIDVAEPTSAVAPVGRIDSIQLLRAIAAFMVAGFHAQSSGVHNAGYDGVFRVFARADAGVDLFFVISGFIIYFTSKTRPGLTMSGFLGARFWRIYPTYWAVLAVYLGVAAIGAATGYEVTPVSVLASAFLLPYPAQIIDIAWTLTIEIVFYAVFALTFFRWGEKGFFAAMAVWSAVALVASPFLDVETAPWSLALYSGVIEFMFGAGVAWAFLRGSIRHAPPLLGLGVALFGVWLAGGYERLGLDVNRAFGAGVPSALILYGVCRLNWKPPAIVLLLGEASYILYLIHLVSFSAIGRVFEKASLNVYGSTFAMALMLGLTVVAACAATAWLERPFQNWYKKRLKRRGGAPGGDPLIGGRSLR